MYGKGGGKDKGGKGTGGKTGEFHGECHWCGKWGHTASRCTDKDAYMDWVRGGKGYGKNHGERETNISQNDHGDEEGWKTVGNPVSTLESHARFVDICNMDKHFPKLKNRYTALSEDRDEETQQEDQGMPRRIPDSVWTMAPRRKWTQRCEIDSVGRNTPETTELNAVDDDSYIELTIDSGAGENVMPEYMAPKTPVRYSREQDAGVVYTAANGDTMPNRGRKVLHVTTKEGQNKAMNMQITDVNRALMSVAKICDAGHTVVFKPEGGVIKNNKTGEETNFRRENNVYRMTVRLNEAGFARQG